MSDIGAPAPAAPASTPAPAAPAPAAPEPVSPPQPLRDGPLPKDPEPKPARSIREIAAEAKTDVEKADKEGKKPRDVREERIAAKDPKPKAAEPAKPVQQAAPKPGEQPRAEGGRFAARDGAKPGEQAPGQQPAPKAGDDDRSAPKRFTPEAREAWDKLGPEHDVLRNEVRRMEREQNAGIEKHRPAAERYHTVYKEFDDLAANSKVDPSATLKSYVDLDKGIHSGDPRQIHQTIEKILGIAGMTPVQYAQAVFRNTQQQPGPGGQPQPGGQQQQQLDPRQLIREAVSEAVRPFTQQQEQQRRNHDAEVLADWAKDKPHFETVKARVFQLVTEEGFTADDAYVSAVTEAQDTARKLLGESGGISPSPAPAPAPAAAQGGQTPKGEKSISGAPSAGSDPATKPRPKESIRDTIKRVMAQT